MVSDFDRKSHGYHIYIPCMYVHSTEDTIPARSGDVGVAAATPTTVSHAQTAGSCPGGGIGMYMCAIANLFFPCIDIIDCGKDNDPPRFIPFQISPHLWDQSC